MNAESTTIVPAAGTGGEIQALKHLQPAEVQLAQEIAQGLDVRDALAISAFGVRPQTEMSALTDPILKMIATKDTGAAGEALSALIVQVKALDAGSLGNLTESVLARLPGVGWSFSKVQQYRARQERVGVKIDRIVVQLEKTRFALSRDVALLDQLYGQNTACLRGLLVHIAAGEMALEALRAEGAALAAADGAAHDPLQAQAIADQGNTIARLERRVHDMKLAAMVSLQTAPQIRLIQNSDQSLTEKIQSSILTTIPLWKNQVVLAIALFDQKKAAILQRRVAETTNEMLRRNAQTLHQGTTEVAREAERGIVEIETLRTVNDELIHTIEDSLQIQEEGRRKRQEAEGQLQQMQAELRAALVAAREMGPLPRMGSSGRETTRLS